MSRDEAIDHAQNLLKRFGLLIRLINTQIV
jgi:hypothetical protein